MRLLRRPSQARTKAEARRRGTPSFPAFPIWSSCSASAPLHPGAAIGYHEQDRDEVYYVLSGTGELTMNGTKSVVGPGTSILTRTGSSHGLRQTGADDLVIVIVYSKSSSVSSH
ncbi:MAG: cupin domain-containing protein [Acidobacteria bacterium]|nr:MAG: cupin domain-containing protein [Acidobacteriota bacterium]